MTSHHERRVIKYQPEALYALVADVKAYPQFLPWCLAARVWQESETKLVADLMVGFQLYREKFTSHVTLNPEIPEITAEYADGPFKHLRNHWVFHPHPEGCEIEFYVDFKFQSHLLQSVMEKIFTEAMKKMVRAFERRADALYSAKD